MSVCWCVYGQAKLALHEAENETKAAEGVVSARRKSVADAEAALRAAEASLRTAEASLQAKRVEQQEAMSVVATQQAHVQAAQAAVADKQADLQRNSIYAYHKAMNAQHRVVRLLSEPMATDSAGGLVLPYLFRLTAGLALHAVCGQLQETVSERVWPAEVSCRFIGGFVVCVCVRVCVCVCVLFSLTFLSHLFNCQLHMCTCCSWPVFGCAPTSSKRQRVLSYNPRACVPRPTMTVSLLPVLPVSWWCDRHRTLWMGRFIQNAP